MALITQHVVSGIVYGYTGDYIIGDVTKMCTVEIWERPWLTTVENFIIKAKCTDGTSYIE